MKRGSLTAMALVAVAMVFPAGASADITAPAEPADPGTRSATGDLVLTADKHHHGIRCHRRHGHGRHGQRRCRSRHHRHRHHRFHRGDHRFHRGHHRRHHRGRNRCFRVSNEQFNKGGISSVRNENFSTTTRCR
jgi:hypothetical protein